MSTSAATSTIGPHDPAGVVARLYEAHADDLTRFCRGQLRSTQEAEDAVQTTFVHAVQALQRGVVPECESAWLYTIARNVCHDQRRASGQRLRHTSNVELHAIPAPEEPDSDLAEELSEALAQLPVRQRRAFVLREWRGLSSNEVATRLGLRNAETYALLTRARRSMAAALAASTGRAALALHLGPLLLKLRALLAGGAAKSAVAATAVVAVAGGALVVGQAADPGSGASRSSRATERDASASSTDDSSLSTAAAGLGPVATSPTRSEPEQGRSGGGEGPSRPTVVGGVDEPGQRGGAGPSPTAATEPGSTAPGTGAAQPGAADTGLPARRVVRKTVPKLERAVRRVRLPELTLPNVPDLLQPVESPVDPLPEVADGVNQGVTDVVETVEQTVPPLPEPLPPPPPAPLLP